MVIFLFFFFISHSLSLSLTHSLTDDFLSSINPILSFTSVQNKLTSDINENLKKFEKPTPIQSISWPLLLDGKDLVGVAKTGIFTLSIIYLSIYT